MPVVLALSIPSLPVITNPAHSSICLFCGLVSPSLIEDRSPQLTRLPSRSVPLWANQPSAPSPSSISARKDRPWLFHVGPVSVTGKSQSLRFPLSVSLAASPKEKNWEGGRRSNSHPPVLSRWPPLCSRGMDPREEVCRKIVEKSGSKSPLDIYTFQNIQIFNI